jgi:uncharacterized protein
MTVARYLVVIRRERVGRWMFEKSRRSGAASWRSSGADRAAARPYQPSRNRTFKGLTDPLHPFSMPVSELYRSLVVAALLTVAGCGADAVPAETPEAPRQETGDLFEEIPREELYGATPAENLWSPRVELEVLDLPRGWNGARIAIISDFQLGLWDGNHDVAAAAVRHAVQADPDLILLLGDFLARGDDTQALQQVLQPLRGRRSIAVLGRRDVRNEDIEAAVTSALEASGVQVLKNSSTMVELRGDTAAIAGLDPDLASRPWADQQWVLATLGTAGRTPILLTHLPALATRAPTGRFPVIVAGNTFCGQTEVPGTPRLQWLRSEVFPGGEIEGRDRLFRVQGSTVLVSCGIGFGFVPIRFGASPEVMLLTLVAVGASAPVEARAAVEDTLIQRFQRPSADTL